MLSSMDDYPLHQIADVIRHVGTSDRNFYDRYYFNLHNCSEEIFVVFGLGQYPTLGVQDAFLLVRHIATHPLLAPPTRAPPGTLPLFAGSESATTTLNQQGRH